MNLRVLAVALTLACLGTLGISSAPAQAACANPVACENQLPGDPASDWQVTGAGDTTIQGFATSMSVNVGQTEYFKINTPSTNYHIDILRLGYYGGDGARKIASNIKPSVTLPQNQPACNTDSSNGLIDCGNWSVSASWTAPEQRRLRHLHRPSCPRRLPGSRRRQPDPVRRPQRREPLAPSSSRPPTRRGRRTTTTAATACTAAPSLAPPITRSPTRGLRRLL